MNQALLKFVGGADVVPMGMREETDGRPLREPRHMRSQAERSRAGIDEEIAVATADVPHVAAEEERHERLVDQRDPLAERDPLIPFLGGSGRQHRSPGR